MTLAQRFEQVLAWAAKNERKLGAALFTLGFITDLLTFGLLPVQVVNVFFLSYLALAAVCTFGTHIVSVFKKSDAWWRQTLSVLFPLGAQYAIGGLLSGFVVFYAKSSVVGVSWPFLLLIAAVYFGNEYFRKHKEHLAFQTVLFFFALYAYTIFALPLYVHSIGPWVFLGSSVAAVAIFGIFLFLLRAIHRARLEESVRPILISTAAVVAVLNVSYFLGLIPPIPLALARAEVYHELTHVGGNYVAATDEVNPWWNPLPRTISHVVGTPLYVYSAVAAPISFSTTVVHRWERYSVVSQRWVQENRVSFPIQGGRAGGYRGYSLKEDPQPGKWRVSIETANGQVIGRVSFTVVQMNQVLLLHQETL